MVQPVQEDPAGAPDAARIFLSFASDDEAWVLAFTNRAWFGNLLGNVRIQNYLAGDNLPFGELGRWLDERIGRAAVVIAFVSADYRSKKWTVAEWLSSLRAAQRDKLIFVPVMLDSDAKEWWASQRRHGGLSVLPDDYQYADFTDGLGKRLNIRPEDTSVTERIKELAKEIRGMLVDRSDEPIDGQRPLTDVVVLGHPTARSAEGVETQSSALLKELKTSSLKVEFWRDGWRGRSAEQAGQAATLCKDAVFVQPLAAIEAADYAASPGMTSTYLERAGITGARVALWLPHGVRDAAFEQKMVASADDQPTMLRSDTPAELAAWLCGALRVETMAAHTLALQIEDLGFEDDTIPDPEAVRLAEEVQEGLCGVVNGIVKPNPPPWPFVGFDPGLKDLITIVQGDRAIIAVHDLDIPPSTEDKTRKAIERKFLAMQDVVQLVESTTKRQLNLFRAALVVRNPKVLPFFKYPNDGRFKDWRLLRFERPDEETPLKPDPASKAYFRAQLAAWATPRKSSQPVH
jgi:hypothetical protein